MKGNQKQKMKAGPSNQKIEEKHKHSGFGPVKENVDKMKGRDQNKKFICEPCGRRFLYLSKLRRHMSTHLTSETKNNLKIYNCAVCEKRFLHKGNLVQHIKEAHLKQDVTCAPCGIRFSTKANLLTHQKYMHGEKELPRLQCSTCQKWFKRKDALKQHVLKHHTQTQHELKKFICEPCGERFVYLTNLRSHMRTHLTSETKNTLRIYNCAVCEKRYQYKNHLIRHIKDAHLKQDVSCARCGRQFTTKQGRLKHQKNVHNERELSRVQCSTCQKWYKNKDSLNRHVLYKHFQTQQFTCAKCGKEYTTKAILKAHMEAIHMHHTS